ncbi:MAG: bacteriohemerythrin [Nitrospirota bacterium]|nr:bacteriohemerythrin [Nitrospirota bacterium]
MAFEWTTDLATGNSDIDRQHQEMFKRINNLLDACTQQKGKEEIGKFLGFLEDYVVEHFNAEEKVMTERHYPGLAAHKQEHEHFKQRIATIKKEFVEFGATIHVVLLAIRTAGDWLISHIRKTDKAMGAFLKGA